MGLGGSLIRAVSLGSWLLIPDVFMCAVLGRVEKTTDAQGLILVLLGMEKQLHLTCVSPVGHSPFCGTAHLQESI